MLKHTGRIIITQPTVDRTEQAIAQIRLLDRADNEIVLIDIDLEDLAKALNSRQVPCRYEPTYRLRE